MKSRSVCLLTAQRWRDDSHLEDLIERSTAKVVVFTWSFDKASISRAFAAGASGYLSKGLTGAEIVTALEAIHAGRQITSQACVRTDGSDAQAAGGWPGQDRGLTPRESEILALITRGLSNEQIAAAVHLSINSVKTYIRTAYRKIGVQTRVQAVRYGMQHGSSPNARAPSDKDGPPMYFDTKPCAVCGSDVRLRARTTPPESEPGGTP